MLLVEQRRDDGVDGHGLTLSRCTGHKQVRRLGEVEHKDIVRDGSSQRHGQTHLRVLLEFLRSNHGVHRHDLRVDVRHLDADRTFSGHRRDDTDADCRERHHDIVLQVLYLGDAHSRLRHHFVERHRRADRGRDGGDLHAVVMQRRDDLGRIGFLFVLVDHRRVLVVVGLQQIQRGELIVSQFGTRVVRTLRLQDILRIVLQHLVLRRLVDVQIRVGVLRVFRLVFVFIRR